MTSFSIAGRVRRIKPSPSASAADRANELRQQGKPIISLVVGEPDFDTPPHIRQAAALAMENGATRYTSMRGTLELRQAIVAKLERENGLSYALDEIIATNGLATAIFAEAKKRPKSVEVVSSCVRKKMQVAETVGT